MSRGKTNESAPRPPGSGKRKGAGGGMNLPNVQDDPWAGVQTVHDFAADELVSALQKSIRRGLVENAVLVAYEMFASGPEFEDHVWRRLEIISVEDVGLGQAEAPLIVRALDEFRRAALRESPDRLIYLVHAVRLLALSPKDRTSDEMATWVRRVVDEGLARPVVFDDMLDMHTRRGQEMGRDFLHWFTKGAWVENELPDRDTTYQSRILEMLRRDAGGS
jgi:replication-associated recombination protein RarA